MTRCGRFDSALAALTCLPELVLSMGALVADFALSGACCHLSNCPFWQRPLSIRLSPTPSYAMSNPTFRQFQLDRKQPSELSIVQKPAHVSSLNYSQRGLNLVVSVD